MSVRKLRGSIDERELARDALKRAAGPGEPDIARLLDAVPGLMVEARRRRAAARPGLASALGAGARQAVVKLAVATAIVVILASTTVFIGRETAGTGTSSFESAILTGAETGGGSSDILLDAVMTRGQNHV